jgi:enoyl-CoA hydratase
VGTYPFFEVEKKPDIKTAILYLNRPDKMNALNWPFWSDLPKVVADLEADPEVRVVVVAGRGKSFTVGIDVFEFFMQYQEVLTGATPERREEMHELLLKMQEGFNRMANGNKIYIAAMHRHCIGAGLDLAAACDLRLASQDAVFSLRETKIAIVADMGSLNRLPKIIGQGHTRMLALTGRDISAAEALRIGLVNELYDDAPALMAGALGLAEEITANAEPAVRGTKQILRYMEDHSETDGLKYVATWNSAFLNTKEIQDAVGRLLSKPKK